MPFERYRPPSGRVGTMIRMKRKADDLSLREAAVKSGVDFSTLSRLESGVTIPNLKNFLRLCNWLGLSPEGAMAVASTMVREHSSAPPGKGAA